MAIFTAWHRCCIRPADMCTNITISTGSNTPVSARTFDFGDALTSRVQLVPRGQSSPQSPTSGNLTWTNQYGFVGTTVSPALGGSSLAICVDGLNEKGLSAAALWLPGTQYATKSSKQTLRCTEVVSWALGTCANVTEVAEALASISIVGPLDPAQSMPLHFGFTDASGNRLVVESMNQSLQIYTASGPVLTNAPSYDWQTTNQSNYENLSLTNVTQQWWGQELNGSGQLGLPGDPTPPSRFVRASLLCKSTYSPANAQQAVGLAQQILQNVVVPYGTILSGTDGKTLADYTQWSVVRDHVSLAYYFSSAFSNVLCGVVFSELNFAAGAVTQIPLAQPTWFEDLSKQLSS